MKGKEMKGKEVKERKGREGKGREGKGREGKGGCRSVISPIKATCSITLRSNDLKDEERRQTGWRRP